MIKESPLSTIIYMFSADIDMPEDAKIAYSSKREIEKITTLKILDEGIKSDNLGELDDIINGDFKDHENRVAFLVDLKKHLLDGGALPNIVDYLDV